jgi:hypothetical protein
MTPALLMLIGGIGIGVSLLLSFLFIIFFIRGFNGENFGGMGRAFYLQALAVLTYIPSSLALIGGFIWWIVLLILAA